MYTYFLMYMVVTQTCAPEWPSNFGPNNLVFRSSSAKLGPTGKTNECPLQINGLDLRCYISYGHSWTRFGWCKISSVSAYPRLSLSSASFSLLAQLAYLKCCCEGDVMLWSIFFFVGLCWRSDPLLFVPICLAKCIKVFWTVFLKWRHLPLAID